MDIFRQLFLEILTYTCGGIELETSRGFLDQIYGKNLRIDGGLLANRMDMSVILRPSEIEQKSRFGKNWLSLGNFFSESSHTLLAGMNWRLPEGL